MMLVLAGVLLILGAAAVFNIKETIAESTAPVVSDIEPEI